MLKMLHPLAGVIATVTVATFWIASAYSEMFASEAVVRATKMAIPWGFLLLIPALIATGASGTVLAKGRRGGLAEAKARRMQFAAANGLLILLPAALFLASKARVGQFDTSFYTVQLLELAAGAANITLLARNLRDGLKMKGRLRRTA